MRRLWNLAPLLLVLLAWLLSAGVVKLMERPRPVPVRAAETAHREPPAAPVTLPRPAAAPDALPGLPEALGTSLLDDQLELSPDADYFSTEISSTSKVSTAPGGITPGTPASP